MRRPHFRFTALLASLATSAALLATTVHAVCNGTLQLAFPTTYTVGTGGDGLTIADFNEDGILDVAVAVSHREQGLVQGEIAVRLGQGAGGVGNGTLGPLVAFSGGLSPIGLEAADLNGDGILDLVTCNFGSNTVAVLRGNGVGGVGDGTFAAPVFWSAGPSPHHLVLADFNEDGIVDIAVANNTQPRLSVLLGLGAGGVGDGTFAPPTALTMNNFGTGIAAADVDNDGILDLMGSEYTSGTIALFKGLGAGGVGNGAFSPAVHITAGPEPYDIEAADFDEDGSVDLVVSNTGAGGLRHLKGNGNGTFSDQGNLITGIIGDADAGDYDNDGILDLFVVHSSGNQFTLLKGQGAGGVGNGTFLVARQFSVPGFPACVVAADLNEDGFLDAAMTNYTANSVALSITTCTATPVAFQITSVRDVPRDQGGRVFVTWNKHPSDATGGVVTGYRVWRRIPAAAALRAAPAAGAERRVTRTAAEVVYWEAAAALPAQRLAAYGYTSQTPQDSMSGSNPYSAFFVTATTSNPDSFFDTATDSGYSVDNLPPLAPSQVSSQYLAGRVVLGWQPNGEADLAGYDVHRGTSAFFVPTQANRLMHSGSLGYEDGQGTLSSFYKIAAVDVHGNVGAYVLVEPNGPVGIELALLSSDPRPGDVELVWYADAIAMPLVNLERRDSDGAWQTLAQGTPDASGRLAFHDVSAVAGGDYRYRLVWITAAGTQTSPEISIRVPGLALALAGARPHPAPSTQLALQFTLRDGSAASLELYDAAGRRVAQQAVGVLGPGPHTVSFAQARLSPGVYLARLAQGTEERRTRVVVIR